MTERCRLCALDFEPDDDTTPGPPICGLCAGTVLGAVRLDIRPNRLLPGGALAGLFNHSAVAAIGRLEAERDKARADKARADKARADHNLLWGRLAAALGFDAPSEGIDLVAVAAYHRRELETVKAALANEADAKGVLTGEVAAIRDDLKRTRERLHEAERANEAAAQDAKPVAALRRQLEGRDQRITDDAELVEALRADVASWRERATNAEGTIAAAYAAAGLDTEQSQSVTLPEHVKMMRESRSALHAEVAELRHDVARARETADEPEQAPRGDGPPPPPHPTNPDTAFWSPFGTVRACRHCGVLVSGGPTACVACVRAAEAAEAKS